MKTFKALLITVLLIGCGTKNSGGNGADSDQSKVEKEKKLASGEYHPSFYVEGDEDLKPCTKDIYGALAYVKKSESFKACLDSGWTQVDVKGKDGVNGTNGTNGVIADNTLWTDPVTKITWKAFGSANGGPIYDKINFTKICDNGYTEPKTADVLTASQNGMYQYYKDFGTHQNVWVFEPVGNGLGVGVGYRRYDTLNVRITGNELASTLSAPQNLLAGVVCIKN